MLMRWVDGAKVYCDNTIDLGPISLNLTLGNLILVLWTFWTFNSHFSVDTLTLTLPSVGRRCDH